MARPVGTGKKPEEKYVARSIRFPPELWRAIEKAAPEAGGRSAFVREAVAARLGQKADTAADRKAREERIRAARGSLAGRGMSVDEFLREKHGEIELEEAAHARRWPQG
jgi:hypothetical protein